MEERQLKKTLACLESKIFRIRRLLEQITGSKESLLPSLVKDFPKQRQRFLEEGGSDLSRYMEEYEETLHRLYNTRQEITAIDS